MNSFFRFNIESLISSLDFKLRTLVFDYDRTIAKVPVDWPSVRVHLRQDLWERYGLTAPESMRVDELEAWALQQQSIVPSDVFRVRRSVETAVATSHEPVAEVVQLIQWLKAEKPEIRLFIISNNLRDTVVGGLKQLGLLDAFTRILGIDDTMDPKPGITAFTLLQASHAIDPKTTLFLGDSDETDGGFCRALGIHFINITHNPS